MLKSHWLKSSHVPGTINAYCFFCAPTGANMNVNVILVASMSLSASDGRNQMAIGFNRDLNRNEDSIQTLRDSIQVPCDLILIRFKF